MSALKYLYTLTDMYYDQSMDVFVDEEVSGAMLALDHDWCSTHTEVNSPYNPGLLLTIPDEDEDVARDILVNDPDHPELVSAVPAPAPGGDPRGTFVTNLDRCALDRIQELMDGREWEGADLLDQIAETVRATGRQIRDPEEYDQLSSEEIANADPQD